MLDAKRIYLSSLNSEIYFAWTEWTQSFFIPKLYVIVIEYNNELMNE